MAHLPSKLIVSYVTGKIGEEEVFHLECHIASCPECARNVRVHRFINDHADALLESFTVPKASHIIFRQRLFDALTLTDLPGEMIDRLISWANDVCNKTKAAVKVSLGGAKKAAEIFANELLPIHLSENCLKFQPVPMPIRVRGDHDPQPVTIEGIGAQQTRITADANIGQITIRLAVSEPPWPLAALIPATNGVLRIKDFHPVEGEDYLLAAFEDLQDGDYTLLLGDAKPEPDSTEP